MVGVAQLVRAPGCGSGGRGFETPHSPHLLLELESYIVVDGSVHPIDVSFDLRGNENCLCESGGIGRRARFRL